MCGANLLIRCTLRRLFLVGMLLGTRGWDVDVNHTILSRRDYWSSYGSDQAVCLKELLVADAFGVEERSRKGG